VGELGLMGALGASGLGVLAEIACRPRTPAGPPAAPPDAGGKTALLTFSAAELATVAAVCERLLPRDEDPGAIDLGVPTYIDRELASPDLASWRDLALEVLPILDRQSGIRHGGKAFVECTPEQQDGLLVAWQRGKGGDKRFFDLMLTLTLEGAFGDPRHGGNAGGRGFGMIGFTPGAPFHDPGGHGGHGTHGDGAPAKTPG
jgi:gluconate 2-dehydrogenase gamma chain